MLFRSPPPELRGLRTRAGEPGLAALRFDVETETDTSVYAAMRIRGGEAEIDRAYPSSERLQGMARHLRRLRERGIDVNLTLGFSARQNLFATEIARPNYVNVFLGRLNAVVADNELGSGENVGERRQRTRREHSAVDEFGIGRGADDAHSVVLCGDDSTNV